jgi:Ca-activated chloride channel homolog
MTMKCPRKTLLSLLGLALVLTAPSLYAQAPASAPADPAAASPAATPPSTTPPATTPQTPTPKPLPEQVHRQNPGIIKVNTQLVVIPVTVKDRQGVLVPDLRKDEFRIFEDNIEQRVVDFTADPHPLSMVVLIDNDLKKKDADAVESSLTSIIAGMSTSDEAFICRFDQFFHEGKGFTHDQDQLLTQLKRTEIDSKSSAPPPGGPFNGPTINGAPIPGAPVNDPSLIAIKGQPTKALDDAVYNSAMLLKDRPADRRRKIILLISDGQNGSKFNTHKYDDTLAELLKQNIAVYSVATGSSYFERKFSRLVSYSHDTGGDVYFGAKAETFSEFYARITEEARYQYTLTFQPEGDRKVDYHKLEVRVRREDLTILTRAGYYGGTFATEAPK